MDVAILAGGRGTRLADITRGKQKCLVDVQGQPFISLLLKQLKGFGLTKIFVMAGFDGQSVKKTVDPLSEASLKGSTVFFTDCPSNPAITNIFVNPKPLSCFSKSEINGCP